MRILVEITEESETAVILESIYWMYYNGDLTKKEKKAYRTVLSHYLNAEQYVERFGIKGVYK